jgi:hypothetical protein
MLGIALFGWLVWRDNPNVLTNLRSGVNNLSAGAESVPNPFGVSNQFAALYHSVGVVTGRFYETMWTDNSAPDFLLRQTLSNVRALILEILFVAGALAAMPNFARSAQQRAILLWFVVPVTLVTALSFIFPNLAVFHHYMMITAPAGYLLAALGFSQLATAIHKAALARAVMILLSIALAAIPFANLRAHVQSVVARPMLTDNLYELPLYMLRDVRATWRECAAIDNPQHMYWVASVNGSARNVRTASLQRANANVWHIQGPRACVSVIERDHIVTHTAAQTLSAIQCDAAPLAVNLGWTLTQFCAPTSAMRGETIVLRHVWQIGGLPPPNSGYRTWRYEPFIKLLDTQGNQVAVAEGVALIGAQWHENDIVVSDVQIALPSNLPSGVYRLEASLFDREHQRAAWYLRPDNLQGAPINSLAREITIR